MQPPRSHAAMRAQDAVGDLEAYLRSARAPMHGRPPLSLRGICRDLADHGVDVTHETVRNWCEWYGIESERQVS